MRIERIVSGPLETNAYLLVDDQTREAVLVDAPHGVSKQLARHMEDGVKVVMLINTHGHWDHIGDNEEVLKMIHAPLAIHSADAEMLKDGGAYGYETPVLAKASRADRLLAGGDVISFGQVSLRVMHTPGHTTGSICLYHEASKTLISGDTLFQGSCGRTDLTNSSESEMVASLRKLSTLPPDTRYYPGHGAGGTIGVHPMLVSRSR